MKNERVYTVNVTYLELMELRFALRAELKNVREMLPHTSGEYWADSNKRLEALLEKTRDLTPKG